MSEDPHARLPGEGIVKGLEYGNRIFEAISGAIAIVSAIVTDLCLSKSTSSAF